MKYKRGYYDILVNSCGKYPSRPAIIIFEDGIYETYTYSELYGVCEYVSQNLQQLNIPKGVVGIFSERNISIPGIIAAIHKQNCTFMFLDLKDDLSLLQQQRNFNLIIAIDYKDKVLSELVGKNPDKSIAVFNLVVNFFCFKENASIKYKMNMQLPEHGYIAMTSGSTGKPKHIQVPMQCILPNIDDLTKLFSVTCKDIIYFSTPLTFDPSMIEILLACMTGACLMIAPEKLEILFPDNKQVSITFWQTTPSKFFQYSNTELSQTILSDKSTLRVLAFGGEPLNGVKRLKEMKAINNATKIYVLYGVTEMSCWACVTELDLNKVDADREIPLGNCLSETQVFVKPTEENKLNGRIILASKTRRCILLNNTKRKNQDVHSLKWIDTGDIGEVRNGTIYYRGRQDDVIKRFGNKVNLHLIESNIMQCPKVKTCACLWLPNPMLLVVYYSSECTSTQELSDFLKCKLDDKHWPDKVVRVDHLPVTKHGKVCKKTLYRIMKNNAETSTRDHSMKLTLLNEIKQVLNKSFTYDTIRDKDFFSIGGTSFLAVSVCNRLAQHNPLLGKSILPYLLDHKNTIEMILNNIIQSKLPSVRIVEPNKRQKTDDLDVAAQETIPLNNQAEFSVVWTYNTGKCVDASPTLFQFGFNLYVTVGSHSGRIIVADARTGNIEGLINIGSRVEAAVLIIGGQELTSQPRGVVGTYDGTIVCFSLETCQELWKINVGSMIKSKAACCNGYVYIGSYDGKIRCIDLKSGDIKACLKIANHAISADLVLAKNEYVIVGTLSGVCCSIHTESNSVAWRGTLTSPIFAAPALYDHDKYVVIAEVNGEIHCRTVEKGIKIWRYQGVRGNIFSSLHISELGKMRWQMVFGCHDNNIYCISIKNYQPLLNWKCALSSSIYSTPTLINNKHVLAVAKNGRISVLEKDNGKIISEYSLPEEVFSSPVVWGDYIYVGCRNDHLYSLKCSL